MPKINQRKLDRYPLERQPNARVALRADTVRYRIDQIRDISDSGISFYLEHPVAESVSVAIEYADPKLKIEVYGRVAWCLQRQDAGPDAAASFVIGVELLSPMMLFAVLQKH